MGSYPKRKAGFDWEMCKDVADIPENPIQMSLSSKVCKFFDFLSAVKLDRRFCIIFVDSHIIGRASHRLLHQSSERWIYQNKSRLFR